MIKIKFPNPYGRSVPTKESVSEMQKRYGFSDAYANFLLVQNGFDGGGFLASPNRGEFLEDTETVECYQDFSVLYGLDMEPRYPSMST
jgi:hypothetical protein